MLSEIEILLYIKKVIYLVFSYELRMWIYPISKKKNRKISSIFDSLLVLKNIKQSLQ